MAKCILALVLALVLGLRAVEAHYMWSHLLVDGMESGEFEFVRAVAPDPTYPPDPPWLGQIAPQLDISTTNITCGRSAFLSAPSTKTADIPAGSAIGFRLSEYIASVDPPAHVFHPGPGQVYLAGLGDRKGALEGWDGVDGEWFKIGTAGPLGDSEWQLLNQKDYNFTIPPSTPPGLYLLRIEQFLVSSLYNYTQFYVNCAHVNILGTGKGQPRGFARFPGSYDLRDPGILVTEEQAQYPPDARNLSSYVAPGPAVWKG